MKICPSDKANDARVRSSGPSGFLAMTFGAGARTDLASRFFKACSIRAMRFTWSRTKPAFGYLPIPQPAEQLPILGSLGPGCQWGAAPFFFVIDHDHVAIVLGNSAQRNGRPARPI